MVVTLPSWKELSEDGSVVIKGWKWPVVTNGLFGLLNKNTHLHQPRP